MQHITNEFFTWSAITSWNSPKLTQRKTRTIQQTARRANLPSSGISRWPCRTARCLGRPPRGCSCKGCTSLADRPTCLPRIHCTVFLHNQSWFTFIDHKVHSVLKVNTYLHSHWPKKVLHEGPSEPMGSQSQGSQPSPLAIFQWFSMHSSQCSPCTFGRQLHRPVTRSQANLGGSLLSNIMAEKVKTKIFQTKKKILVNLSGSVPSGSHSHSWHWLFTASPKKPALQCSQLWP